jgi:hypothetical protein
MCSSRREVETGCCECCKREKAGERARARAKLRFCEVPELEIWDWHYLKYARSLDNKEETLCEKMINFTKRTRHKNIRKFLFSIQCQSEENTEVKDDGNLRK